MHSCQNWFTWLFWSGRQWLWVEISVYGNVQEHIPDDIHIHLEIQSWPLPMLMPTFTIACSLEGYHWYNPSAQWYPLEWYSKRQATVETATYGFEFVAAWIATDQIIDIHISLHYLGIPNYSKSYMFGNNQSVVTSSSIPHSGLNKRCNALSYHHVWEAIAVEILVSFMLKASWM